MTRKTDHEPPLMRAFALLEHIAHAQGAVSLQALTAAAALPKPTVYRMLGALEEAGLVMREPEGRRVVAGPRLARLALDVLMNESARAPRHAILQRLDVSVHGNRLEISLKSNPVDWLFNLGDNKGVSVRVSVPVLDAADSNSGADVDVHGLVAETVRLSASSGAGLSADGIASKFVTLDSSSGANLTATGTCSKLIANASSGGGIAAAGLACSDVNADASSGAHAEVRATESINANASVGAGIVIHGRPAQVNVNSSVGGSVAFSD